MKKLSIISVISAAVLMSTSVQAMKDPTTGKKGGGSNVEDLAAGCTPATNFSEMEINNIKIRMQTGGDFYTDPTTNNSGFEVPKNGGAHSMYAGALWLGGTDISGQLKVAAQMYRDNGNDFWTGPLSTVNAEITGETCAEYDKHFASSRSEVEMFVGWNEAQAYDAVNGTNTANEGAYVGYTVPASITDWPAHGRVFEPYNEDLYLAPFTDVDGDGIYNYTQGDYPGYDLAASVDCSDRKVSIYGDENLWWVFNDKGNIHTQTQSNQIGMEIRAQAFGFATNDEVNNMTFMNFELINRSTFTLTETYFGVFMDPDVGGANDDFVGCDVMKGLAYCYNGDEDDESANGAAGYGANPPAIGVDFFEGPYQDNDGVANAFGIEANEALNGVGYTDSIVDNERFGMRRFVFFTRPDLGASCCVDPDIGTQYYNYLRGVWKDGTKMVYGGTGHDAAGAGIEADFMFPGDSDDSLHWGTKGVDPGAEWTELTAGNAPSDRRFIQSAGPFTLTPGSVNDITVGVVWAKAQNGGSAASLDLVIKADEKTQALFDACFRVLDGPHAPQLSFQEMDQELICYITNPAISNNYREEYEETSAFIIPPTDLTDEEKYEYQTYKFQGYKVYQLKDDAVSVNDLGKLDLARLAFQCDVEDTVTRIINYYFDQSLQANIPVEEVDGNNDGIAHSFQITEDLFASGDKRIVNHKTYYYMAVAYGYNNYEQYDPLNHNGAAQLKPYLESRKSPTGGITFTSAIPHKSVVELNGTTPNSVYGDVVDITRIEGIGNSGQELRLTEASIAEIMAGAPWIAPNPVYEKGYTPIEVKVIDPLNVVAGGDFTVKFIDDTVTTDLSDARWIMYNAAGDSLAGSAGNISIENEELVFDYGISIKTKNSNNPEDVLVNDLDNGLLSASMEFEDGSLPWLSGIPDEDGPSNFNWIRVGTASDDADPEWNDWQNRDIVPLAFVDETQKFEQILGGTWAPSYVTAGQAHGPMSELADLDFYYNGSPGVFPGLAYLHSVDIVFTSDKSKWTRCPVLEMQADSNVSENRGWKGLPRMHASVDKDGNAATWDHTTDPSTWAAGSTSESSASYISPYGMGWFPGYAIDIETGERLNMAFGEDSWLAQDNGDDMIWNPTSNLTEGPFGNLRGGGKHFVFVFRNNIVEEDFIATGPPDVAKFNKQSNRMPGYDAGAFLMQTYKAAEDLKRDNSSQKITNCYKELIYNYRAAMWTGYPLLANGQDLLATDATVRLRVKREFERFGTQDAQDSDASLSTGTTYFVQQGPVTHDGVSYNRGEVFTAVNSTLTHDDDDSLDVVVPTANAALPMYQFNIDHLATEIGDDSLALSALDLIQIVPNPYYAYSQYEVDRLDNRVKITNLPDQCTIKIYTINGSLIREFSKDDQTITSIDWDLKNHMNVPISSGVYVIHVDVPNIGTKILKWFGVMRPVDLDSF